jgi:hypothetical protein
MKLAVLGLALFGMSAFGETWEGYISDAKCGKGHADGSEKSINCVKGCVKGGQAAVFVVGDKVLSIDAKSAPKVTEAMLGKKVKINGKLKGETVSIKKISVAA